MCVLTKTEVSCKKELMTQFTGWIFEEFVAGFSVRDEILSKYWQLGDCGQDWLSSSALSQMYLACMKTWSCWCREKPLEQSAHLLLCVFKWNVFPTGQLVSWPINYTFRAVFLWWPSLQLQGWGSSMESASQKGVHGNQPVTCPCWDPTWKVVPIVINHLPMANLCRWLIKVMSANLQGERNSYFLLLNKCWLKPGRIGILPFQEERFQNCLLRGNDREQPISWKRRCLPIHP